ncbi:hypothetical protein D3C85_1022230 [compost metagenome]
MVAGVIGPQRIELAAPWIDHLNPQPTGGTVGSQLYDAGSVARVGLIRECEVDLDIGIALQADHGGDSAGGAANGGEITGTQLAEVDVGMRRRGHVAPPGGDIDSKGPLPDAILICPPFLISTINTQKRLHLRDHITACWQLTGHGIQDITKSCINGICARCPRGVGSRIPGRERPGKGDGITVWS